MTAVDSQTIMSLDAPDFILSAKKDNDDAQVGVLKVTSEAIETPSSDPDAALIYFRKGKHGKPVGGGMRAGQTIKQATPSSSSNNNPPPNPAHQRTVATNSPKTPNGSSKDKTKKK